MKVSTTAVTSSRASVGGAPPSTTDRPRSLIALSRALGYQCRRRQQARQHAPHSAGQPDDQGVRGVPKSAALNSPRARCSLGSCPMISVVIPVRNGMPWLKEQLQALLPRNATSRGKSSWPTMVPPTVLRTSPGRGRPNIRNFRLVDATGREEHPRPAIMGRGGEWRPPRLL